MMIASSSDRSAWQIPWRQFVPFETGADIPLCLAFQAATLRGQARIIEITETRLALTLGIPRQRSLFRTAPRTVLDLEIEHRGEGPVSRTVFRSHEGKGPARIAALRSGQSTVDEQATIITDGSTSTRRVRSRDRRGHHLGFSIIRRGVTEVLIANFVGARTPPNLKIILG